MTDLEDIKAIFDRVGIKYELATESEETTLAVEINLPSPLGYYPELLFGPEGELLGVGVDY